MLSLIDLRPRLLRPGGISRKDLEKVVGPIDSAQDQGEGAHPAPGMHPRHYSPRTPLYLVANGKLPAQGHGIYLKYEHPPSRSDIVVQQMPTLSSQYAAVLYKVLHQADAGNFEWIAVDRPPSNARLGGNQRSPQTRSH